MKRFWNNKKVLITGGAGFIGSNLSRRLLEEGAKITIADSFLTGGYYRLRDIEDKIKLFNIDLRELNNCKSIIFGQEYVFHLAANMGGMGYISKVGADIIRDNLLINLNMLEASSKSGVIKFFYPSSACVYPSFKQTSTEVDELKEGDAIPANPDTYYGWEKLMTEKSCEAFNKDHDLEVRVARFHNIYGPYAAYTGKRAKVVGSLIRKVINYPKEDFIIWGDGKQTRSFCYILDAIEGILKLMRSRYNKPVNIGSDRLISIGGLADIIINISGKDIKKKYDLTKPQGVRGRNADLTLCKKILKWSPKITLEEGVENTYRWVENDIRNR